jgi:hypothetical protein
MSTARLTIYFLALPGALIAAFFIAWIWAITSSRALILVTNQSGSTISNLVISGACERRQLDILSATSDWKTVTPYRSGGYFQFSFVSAGSSHSVSPDTGTNLSGSCGISFTISSNMAVTSSVRK